MFVDIKATRIALEKEQSKVVFDYGKYEKIIAYLQDRHSQFLKFLEEKSARRSPMF